YRRRQKISEHERRGDASSLPVRKIQLRLERRQHRRQDKPVQVIEQVQSCQDRERPGRTEASCHRETKAATDGALQLKSAALTAPEDSPRRARVVPPSTSKLATARRNSFGCIGITACLPRVNR